MCDIRRTARASRGWTAASAGSAPTTATRPACVFPELSPPSRAQHCTDLWRQYHYITVEIRSCHYAIDLWQEAVQLVRADSYAGGRETDADRRRWCFNCGRAGHFGKAWSHWMVCE